VPLAHGVGGVAPARQRLRQHRVLEAHLYIYIATYFRISFLFHQYKKQQGAGLRVEMDSLNFVSGRTILDSQN
jgi:hypothetical protein